MPRDDVPPRPGGRDTAATPDQWAETYRDAERWVDWTARRRWPAFPVNNQIWAMSVASWYQNGRSGRAA